MRRIAVWSQKGGSGKTTTTVNLAAALAARGRRVLVVDLDPQSHATQWLGVEPAGELLLSALTDRSGSALLPVVPSPAVPGVDLVPASHQLVEAEAALSSIPAGEQRLARLLARLPAQPWDYLLADLPPASGQLTFSALLACSEVLCPVEASHLAVDGLAAVRRFSAAIVEELNPALRWAGVLLFRFDPKEAASREVLEACAAEFGPALLKTRIRPSAHAKRAYGARLPITAFAPGSLGALDFAALAEEIEAGSTYPIQPEEKNAP